LLVEDEQVIHVTNADRQYDYPIKLESERPLSTYDYVLTDSRGTVVDYGLHAGGELIIPAGGRLAVMPIGRSVLALSYPAQWDEGIFKHSESSVVPMYRAVYKPGERFTLHNRTRGRNAYTFHVQNNSTYSTASFFVREGRESIRIAADELPVSGVITVPDDTSITIIVAAGSDLMILMPVEWARQLIR
jgi:hypothetical protein